MSNLISKYKRATPKQLMLAGVFMLALAGTIGLGLANRPSTMAAIQRDSDDNAIMRYGAADANEFVSKARQNTSGRNGDLPAIYSRVGLPASQYNTFAGEAKSGWFFRDGHIEVAGQTVATGAKSMGRKNFGNSTALKIGSTTYYFGTPTQRWADGVTKLPVMVWFDDNGEAKVVIMNPCGNPVPHMYPKKPTYSCDLLNKFTVDGKKNTYQFSTDASSNNLANVVKFTYSYNDGSGWKVFDTTTSESEKTKEITFEKSSKVRVEIEVVFLNGKKKTGITSVLCEKEIGVVKEEFLYVCDALIATARDNTNRKFRFTVFTKQSNNVSVDSADFTLDGTTTTEGVTAKDDDGNFFKDYNFNDTKTHTVSVIVNFTADGKTVTSKEGDCVAEVTPEEEPKCPHNPELPPNDPKCKPPVEECVPEGKEDENCELPSTGPAGVAGLVAGVTAAGAVGHRLFVNRRSRS